MLPKAVDSQCAKMLVKSVVRKKRLLAMPAGFAGRSLPSQAKEFLKKTLHHSRNWGAMANDGVHQGICLQNFCSRVLLDDIRVTSFLF